MAWHDIHSFRSLKQLISLVVNRPQYLLRGKFRFIMYILNLITNFNEN